MEGEVIHNPLDCIGPVLSQSSGDEAEVGAIVDDESYAGLHALDTLPMNPSMSDPLLAGNVSLADLIISLNLTKLAKPCAWRTCSNAYRPEEVRVFDSGRTE